LDNYLNQPPTGAIEPLATFWNDPVNKGKFPNLLVLVRKFCSLPASSVESERLFSTAKIIMSDLRNRLSAKNLRMLLFLHHTILLNSF
jgi:hypothetical protein